jgi:pimeloyl-ACP methyl ester carboxylesterase
MLQFLKLTLVVSAVSWIGLAAFALLFANKMIFPAPPSSYKDSDAILKIPYGSGGYVISAVYLPNPDADKVIFYHSGNGEDLGNIMGRLQDLQKRGFSVFAYDYPGYGTSTGSPNQKTVYQSAEAGVRHLREELGYQKSQIILYGRSLGGGPTAYLAKKDPYAGLILEGVFTSTFRVMTRVRVLPWDIFDVLGKIPHIQCPVLVIHGTRDFTVPFHHGQTLWRHAPETKSFLWIDGGGHNNLIENHPEAYWLAFSEFTGSL